jgi:hypothetical protein
MAIIYSYPTESPSSQDLLLGMQSSDGKKTVVFTVGSLVSSLSGSIINNNLPASFSTISASGQITGNLTGNVTGNLTGNVTGNTNGVHSGSLNSNVTATTQSSSANDTKIATTAFVQSVLPSAGPFEEGAGTSIIAKDASNIEKSATTHSFAIGNNNYLAGNQSLVGGVNSSVELDKSLAYGSNVSIADSDTVGVGLYGAFAVGQNTIAAGEGAFTTGLNTEQDNQLVLVSGGSGFSKTADRFATATDTQSANNPLVMRVKLAVNSSGVVTSLEPMTFPFGMTAGMPFEVSPSGGGTACQFTATTGTITKVGSHGNFTHTLGKNCYSDGQFSLAGGLGVNMIGDYCFSWGNANKVTPSATATMYHNTLFGYNNTSQPGGPNGWGGIHSTVFGRNNDLYDVSLSIVNGEDITATQCEGSLITGDLHTISASDWGLISGYENTVGGESNAVSGTLNTVTGDYSLVSGKQNTVSGLTGITAGYNNTASGNYSLVSGAGNTAALAYSFVHGNNNSITGVGGNVRNAIIGSANTILECNSSTVIGSNNTLASGANNSFVQGQSNTIAAGSTETFVFGNLNTIDGSRGGSLGYKNETNGDYQIAIGRNLTVQGADRTVAVGSYNTPPPSASDTRFAVGTGEEPTTGAGAAGPTEVGRVEVYAPGANYESSPTYATQNNTGSGSGLTMKVIGFDSGFGVTKVEIVASGSGYNIGDEVELIYAGSATGAKVIITGLGDGSYNSLEILKPVATTPGFRNSSSGLIFAALKDSPSYSSDSTAAAGGVRVGELYHTAGAVKIRLT